MNDMHAIFDTFLISDLRTESLRFTQHPYSLRGFLIVRLVPAELLHVGFDLIDFPETVSLVKLQPCRRCLKTQYCPIPICFLCAPGQKFGACSSSMELWICDENIQPCINVSSSAS